MESIGKKLQVAFNQRNQDGQYDRLMKEVLSDSDVERFLQMNQEKLTTEMIAKSEAKLYEFVQAKKDVANRRGAGASGYEPMLTLNYHFIDVVYVPTEELKMKQKAQAIRSRIRSMNMPKDIREANMANFEKTEDRGTAILAAIDFIDQYIAEPKGYHQALYLYGSFGVGKTYLLGAIAHELAEYGYVSTLVHFPSFAVEMKQSIGDNTLNDKLQAVKSSPILMLDDVGADAMTTWIRDDILGTILQYRMQEQLPTFFSSNFNMSQLENEHLRVNQRGEDEPMKAQRLMERIRFLAKEVTMIGQNRRQH